MMINANNEEQVLFNLNNRREELQNKQGLSPKKSRLKKALESCEDFSVILESIKKNHTDISDFFFSGIGKSLQNSDSKMALEIVEHFYQKGIPVLPMHDSFIIENSCASGLKEKMKEVFRKYNYDFECQVK